MNIKTILIYVSGISIFLVIYFLSMISAITLLIGVGLGLLIFKPVNEIFKNIQRGIYLSEKQEMVNRKKELESELEKLKGTE
jgi:hypothetical protein